MVLDAIRIVLLLGTVITLLLAKVINQVRNKQTCS